MTFGLYSISSIISFGRVAEYVTPKYNLFVREIHIYLYFSICE